MVDSELRDYPDLGLVEPKKHVAPSQCLPHVDEGEIVGSILCFDVYEDVISNPPNELSKIRIEAMEKAGQAVGRIIAWYKSPLLSSPRLYVGSGIRVSPHFVLTAKHVVKPAHDIFDDQQYKIGEATLQIIFYPRNQAQVENITFDAWPFKLVPISEDRLVDRLFEQLYDTGVEYKEWATQNDFVFLRFASKLPTCAIAFPRVAPSYNNIECFVVGYPDKISFDKFSKDYNDDRNRGVEESKRHYEQLEQLMQGFEKKTIFSATCSSKEGLPLVFHHCLTIRGTSGGLFETLPADEGESLSHPAGRYFSGIHLGGSMEQRNNFPPRDQA